MSCYISSNENRVYAALENEFGKTPTVTAQNRVAVTKLNLRSRNEKFTRKDKTGRTFQGLPGGMRRDVDFRLRMYMTGVAGLPAPAYEALLGSAMGNVAATHGGGTIASILGSAVAFSAAHNLRTNQAVCSGTEIRFVSQVVDATTVILNAPFSGSVVAGSTLAPTATYFLGPKPKSMSIYDHWSPAEALQRISAGAVADEMKIRINGDLHEFEFAGPSARLIDNATFAAGQAGLSAFPTEPAVGATALGVIPGHLGQVWLGATPTKFFTLTEAEVSLKNNVDLRNREFGVSETTCYTAGQREVAVKFALFEQPDEATLALYRAAQSRTPISAMFQLGQRTGELCGIYMKQVIPEIPATDDGEPSLILRFNECRAQGVADDELVVAFA